MINESSIGHIDADTARRISSEAQIHYDGRTTTRLQVFDMMGILQ